MMRAVCCAVVLVLASGAMHGAERPIAYPETRRVDRVDEYHGVKVADPYRWLEDDVRVSKEVEEWVERQNEVTFRYLETLPEREKIRKRLAELWDYPKYSPPVKEGGRYYYQKNDGLQNQAVLYRMDSLDGEAKVLIDPNTWSKDGTIALQGTDFSEDGRYVVFGRSEAGSDWTTWRVMEIESGRQLDDEIRWNKFTTPTWDHEGKGFFYTRYDEPQKGAEFQSLNFNSRVCYHRLGTAQSADALVYHRPENPDWFYDCKVTDDGRYLVITTAIGTDEKYRVTVKDLEKPGEKPIELVDHFRNEYTFVGNDGRVFFFKTDLQAPRRRLVAIDLDRSNPEAAREVIPQSEATLTDVSLVGNRFIATYLQDVQPRVKLYSLAGEAAGDVQLPGIGSVYGFEGEREDMETFYLFSSFNAPPTIYRYDIASGKSTPFRSPEVKFDPSQYEVKQVFYSSRDGTRVPMFLAYKKGIKLDGSNPTLLYGYGGFNISLPATFAVTWLSWMDMGGVYAQANLRGGGEYGDPWHRAGTRLQKQNVFDDFIAAAEWLIAERYTRSDRLAIIGRSNGGLLVGAAMTQRPDLFGACLPGVGVMDMLRFHKFTEGRLWIDDYGSSDDPEEFKALSAYSPYHNIKPDTCYPATMVLTADTDDRVIPGHSFKFAAALQRAQACDNPVLIRIDVRAGHGAGKPTAKRIEELADQWAFLVDNLKMELPEGYGSGGRGDSR